MLEPTDTQIVVIGAGQAGLAVSYYLQRLGLEAGQAFVVLDRGPASGGAWQSRWPGLRIGTAHRINDLPGMDELGLSFETADRKAPARDVVADYYRRYEDHFAFQIVRPAEVIEVTNRGTDLDVFLRDDEGHVQSVSTRIMIHASGTWGAPFVPWAPWRDTFLGRRVHPSD